MSPKASGDHSTAEVIVEMVVNQRGQELLIQVWLRNHRQAFGDLHALWRGECALGVLHLNLHTSRSEAVTCWVASPPNAYNEVREAFDISESEEGAIEAGNDVEHWDFLTIARKFGRSTHQDRDAEVEKLARPPCSADS